MPFDPSCALGLLALQSGRPLLVRVAAAASLLVARFGASAAAGRRGLRPQLAARTLQRALLPSPAAFPAPCRPVVRCEPSPAVAGDLLVAVPDPNPDPLAGVRFGCLLVDPPGAGVDAVALAARLKLAAADCAAAAPHPAEFLSRIAAELAPAVAPRLVAALSVWVDLSAGRARFAAAGHPPPFLVRAGGAEALPVSGPAVGLDPAPVYDELDRRLRAGDRIVLASDGFARQPGPGGEPYGEARLAVELVGSAPDSPAEAADLLVGALADWRGPGASLDDDLLVAIFDLPDRGAPRPPAG